MIQISIESDPIDIDPIDILVAPILLMLDLLKPQAPAEESK